MAEGGNDQLFMNLSHDFKGLQQGFQEHEKEFSKFTGASEQRDKRIDEKLTALLAQDKAQDAVFDACRAVIDSLDGRVSTIEIERKKDRERRVEKDKEQEREATRRDRKHNLILGGGIIVATVLPMLYQIFVA